jgi:hypothetical protein
VVKYENISLWHFVPISKSIILFTAVCLVKLETAILQTFEVKTIQKYKVQIDSGQGSCISYILYFLEIVFLIIIKFCHLWCHYILYMSLLSFMMSLYYICHFCHLWCHYTIYVTFVNGDACLLLNLEILILFVIYIVF